MKEQLEARKKELETEFKAMQAELKKLNEQGAEINRRISLTRDRIVELNAAYIEVGKMLESLNPPKIEEVREDDLKA